LSLKNKIVIIKIGGNLVSNDQALEVLAQDIALIVAQGFFPVIIHGGGNEISYELRKQSIKPVFHHGLRVTDEKTLRITEMVLSGLVNKRIVSQLNSHGIKSVGISGKDGSTLLAKNVGEEKGGVGLVGEIEKVDISLIKLFEQNNFIPVISPISMDEKGRTLNVNADSAAEAITIALNPEYVYYLTEAGGVYDERQAIIPELKLSALPKMIDSGTIAEGMIPKIKSVERIVRSGIKNIIICGCVNHELMDLISQRRGNIGTKILL